MSDLATSLEATIEHLKGVIHHADEILAYEREQRIIVTAQRDQALQRAARAERGLAKCQGTALASERENVELKCAADAQSGRIKWLEHKVAGLETQWAMRPRTQSHAFGACCQPAPGQVYTASPQCVTVDAFFNGFPATFEHPHPISVTLTF